MAQLVFQSNEAKNHFKGVVAAAITADTYFSERGLHNRLEYLRTYGDRGERYKRDDQGRYSQWRVLFGVGYSVNEVNIIWQTRQHITLSGKPYEESWTEWETFLVGGLIGHDDGSWMTHT
jgi:hypothetical protein